MIDNAPIDRSTAEVVDRVSSLLPIRYVQEPRTGLSNARNRGYRESTGQFVAFIDDDCRLPPTWIEKAIETIESKQPDVVGGPYYPVYERPPPKWFQDRYGSHEPADRARPLRDGEYLNGGNIIFRRSTLVELGGFDVRLGMRGDQLGYGEETAFLQQLRVRRPGCNVLYEPELAVGHLVRSEKYSWMWQIRQRWADGRSWVRLAEPDRASNLSPVRFVGELAIWIMRLGHRLWGGVTRDRRRYPYYRSWFYEEVLGLVRQLGALVETARRSI